jgi:hypothetical protein
VNEVHHFNPSLIEHDRSRHKGSAASAQALNNAKTAGSWASPLMASGSQQLAPLNSFFQQEAYNPQGFGQQALNQMTTQAGQNTAAALGTAEEQQRLGQARSGTQSSANPATDSYIRRALSANANTGLDIGLQNNQLKQQQQQAGIAGLQGLSQEEIQTALNSIAASNGGVQAWSTAMQANPGAFQTAIGDIGTLGQAAGSVATGLGIGK